MAQKVLIEMVDDLDGGEAAQTVPFALDGVSYEIDLSQDNAGSLRGELDRYISAARRSGGRKVRPSAPQPATPRNDRARQIREWARGAGFEVSARGRISADIERAYEDAHSEPKVTAPARRRSSGKKAAGKR